MKAAEGTALNALPVSAPFPASHRTAMSLVKYGERVFHFFIKSFFSGFLSVGSG
jgi:hypothetical protein